MDARQAEVERFLRAATMFENKAIKLSELDSEAAKRMAVQAIDDANAMTLRAWLIADGWTIVGPEGETK